MPDAFVILKTCHLLPLRLSIPIVNKALLSQPLKAMVQTKHGDGRYYMVGHTTYEIALLRTCWTLCAICLTGYSSLEMSETRY